MALSIREQILAAITTVVDGEYGVPAPVDERDLPQTVVDDGQDAITAEYDISRIEMPVVIARAAQAVSGDRSALRAQANAIYAAIVEEMAADETFGGLADEAELTGGLIIAEVGKFVEAQTVFTVRFHHLRGDPYTIE